MSVSTPFGIIKKAIKQRTTIQISRIMTDCFSKEKRSEVMSKIKSKGSKMELVMLEALNTSHVNFEYQPKIFGKPDFLVEKNIAIFCDSSFWHGRNWSKLSKKLSGNWVDHIERNRKRDKIVNKELKKNGFIVLRFWDYEIKKNLSGCIKRIEQETGKS
jgi:DNA mismatch endonuclease, patch repair protein